MRIVLDSPMSYDAIRMPLLDALSFVPQPRTRKYNSAILLYWSCFIYTALFNIPMSGVSLSFFFCLVFSGVK
jgi:hypothetical protein